MTNAERQARWRAGHAAERTAQNRRPRVRDLHRALPLPPLPPAALPWRVCPRCRGCPVPDLDGPVCLQCGYRGTG